MTPASIERMNPTSSVAELFAGQPNCCATWLNDVLSGSVVDLAMRTTPPSNKTPGISDRKDRRIEGHL